MSYYVKKSMLKALNRSLLRRNENAVFPIFTSHLEGDSF
jgi:hypothetical protein